mmetsp:Transcript_29113/g.70246  ORF Transcript_29113/g.70246 Transcript_29113/m.70246 type:complete len:97 (+) Transcript_29113:50-340(+)
MVSTLSFHSTFDGRVLLATAYHIIHFISGSSPVDGLCFNLNEVKLEDFFVSSPFILFIVPPSKRLGLDCVAGENDCEAFGPLPAMIDFAIILPAGG